MREMGLEKAGGVDRVLDMWMDGWCGFVGGRKPIQFHNMVLRLAFKYAEHLQYKHLIEFSISLWLHE